MLFQEEERKGKVVCREGAMNVMIAKRVGGQFSVK
jgi:hypothetical protein